MRNLFFIIALYMISPAPALWAGDATASGEAMREVQQIAAAVQIVQPSVSDIKANAFAIGIRRAALKYQIDPLLLVAITQQESGFREELPEGPAGELGVCQILKTWAANPKFRAEFGQVSEQDLRKPSRSFLYAAWILRDLKNTRSNKQLPFWSYYNSAKLEHRLRYFIAVNRKLTQLNQAARVRLPAQQNYLVCQR